MQGSNNAERIRTKRRLFQFTRTVSTLDLRQTELDRKLAERKRQAERYEQRHGTAGKRSVFISGVVYPAHDKAEGNSGTARADHRAAARAFV